MVLPLLEYYDVAWHDCGLEDQQKIERLQRRASRIVPKNSRELTSYAIIEKLGWKPFPDRREEDINKELVNNCFKGTVLVCSSRGILTPNAMTFIHITLGLARIFLSIKLS